MAFGVTPEGFNKKTLEDIKESIRQRQHDAPLLGPTFDNAENTAIGQANGTVSSEIAEAWEAIEEAYHSYDPDAAEDASLENVSAITGTTPRDAAPSEVILSLSLNAGTLVPAGAVVARSDRDDIRFQTTVDVENTGGSPAVFTVTATCTQNGPIAAPAGTLTVIVTPFSGWTAVTNAADAEEGRLKDNNIQLRQRRYDQLALRGGSTVDAIRADILDRFEAVEFCVVFENTSDATDPETGLPPHSIEVLIDDGSVPTVDEDELAQAIWETKPGGIRTYGSSSGLALSGDGNQKTVFFSRVTRVPIYVELDIEIDFHYPSDGDEQVEAAVIAEGKERFDPGSIISAEALASAAFSVAGVIDVPAKRIGRTASPTTDANIVMLLRERPIFSTDNTEITVL